MNIEEVLKDKSLKAKQKKEMLSKSILDGLLPINNVIAFAKNSKDAAKASCLEAIEYATKENPGIATESVFIYATQCLAEEAPRVKWESAKVIGNTAHLFTEKIDNAIVNLLVNTEHNGTVVRWSAAHALAQILQIRTPHSRGLLPAIENIYEREEDNAIKKIYMKAIKKAKK